MDALRFQPPLFLAHGSPMLAIEGGAWGAWLASLPGGLPPVRGVVVCSAHWETPGGFRVTTGAHPRTIHDFGGFPEVLYGLQYPAPGDPALAVRVAELLGQAGEVVQSDQERGFDHGAWVPLRHLFPEARVPVIQLSLPRPRDPRRLWAAGRALAPLREEGVLILGSGGLVHNLGLVDWAGGGGPQPWAQAFEGWLLERLGSERPETAMDWIQAPGARESVPTTEHLDPLWLALGAGSGGAVRTVFEDWQLGSLSLRCLAFG
jgi:4,5-DOPA dioxygenase extradiol